MSKLTEQMRTELQLTHYANGMSVLRRSMAMRTYEALERRGLLKQVPNDFDGWHKFVLTDKGREVVSQLPARDAYPYSA